MKIYLKTKDFANSGEEFQLLLDPQLEMLITDPKPIHIEKYYDSTSYISHTDASTSFMDKMYQLIKKYNLRKKVRQVKHYTNDGHSLLDVGAGTGDFLRSAEAQGWNTKGVEPSPKARNVAKKKGIHLEERLADVKGKKFDAITLWHVLEHMPDLENSFRELSALLEEKGTLFIAVPNYKSFDAQFYGRYWAAYDVPRHLWHFSKSSIHGFCEKNNLNILTIKPMIFDAFYISLLSEKYKHGKSSFLKALFIGMRSNLAAWRTKEYSSLVYVIKRG